MTRIPLEMFGGTRTLEMHQDKRKKKAFATDASQAQDASRYLLLACESCKASTQGCMLQISWTGMAMAF